MPEGSALLRNSRLRLSNGVEVAIRCAQPPLPPEEARRIVQFVGYFLVEEYLNAILLGEFSEAACFTAGLGLLGDSVVATCWSGWGREFSDIAVMGGVATAEAYRGQGVASAVVGAVCERFDSAGGRFLYLGASNPAARRIYERLGFRRVAGQIFCRAAREARPDEGFAAGRTVAARPASWRDMASIVPLYLQPHPCVLADAGIGLLSARVAEPRRCVRIFWDLWKSIEPAGIWTILRNDLGWPVASALARHESAQPCEGSHPSDTEPFLRTLSPQDERAGRTCKLSQGSQYTVDFLWHPDYSVEAAAFAAKWLEEIEAASGCACRMLICDGDDCKLREARRLGFEPAEGGGGTVDVNGRKVPLLCLVRQGAS
jgi:ribosomal protein S18 acetylase RimI-like enzyme